MMLSVIVCTYNRCGSLRDTLLSLVRQQAAGVSYEIVVVDNNSTDRTRQVVEEIAGQAPVAVRYLFEGRQGLSCARNAGIKTAQGEVLAFVDDDVIVDARYVAALSRCVQETGADAVGGKIERLWHCDPPRWYAEELGGVLISQDLGPARKRWDQPARHMVGANIAFQRDVFARHGLFAEELGRRGQQLLGGEDREMFVRLMHAGCQIVYEPAAIVWHKVDAERLSKAFMRRWFWSIGQTLGHEMDWRWHHRLTAAPVWLWGRILGSVARCVAAYLRPAAGEAERFASEAWVRFHIGMLTERLIHWLPRGLAAKRCAFAGH